MRSPLRQQVQAHHEGHRRSPERIIHPQATHLAQQVFGLAAGYEDLNDHALLRNAPLWQAANDHPEVGGSAELGSAPTLCRLESRIARADLVLIAAVLVDRRSAMAASSAATSPIFRSASRRSRSPASEVMGQAENSALSLRPWTLENKTVGEVRCVIAAVVGEGWKWCGNSFLYRTFNRRAIELNRLLIKYQG